VGADDDAVEVEKSSSISISSAIFTRNKSDQKYKNGSY